MVAEWRRGADVVNMTRTRRLGESAFKMWVTRQAYRLINWVSDIDIPMNTGDFKLLSRRVVDELVRLREIDPFLRGLVRWVGFRQVTLYYERQARHGGVTHFPLLGSGPAKAFIAGITSFSQAPLYLGLLLGGLVSIFSFLYLLFIVITTLVFKMNLPGWPAMMVTMLALGGVILFTQGIQGVYIGRIHAELKRRPNYIISDMVNVRDGGQTAPDTAGAAGTSLDPKDGIG